MGDLKIGFYNLVNHDNQLMIGALLVTDDLGKPEEFRVTYPVKPTVIQRQLYGDSLLTHVGVDLCGLPLIEALKQRPQLIVVSNPAFLSMAGLVPSHIVYLERAGASLVVNTADNNSVARISSDTGRFQPISVHLPHSYNDAKRTETTRQLEQFFRGFDLLEPFDRITIALRTLQESDERFR